MVVKSYVRDKQLVDLPSQTATLLASLGFSVFLRVHALLTETTEEPSLFGEPVKSKKERKSFFRRLAEKKGSPAIDFEVVLFARKVGGESGVLNGLVTSPPWVGVVQGTDTEFFERMEAQQNPGPRAVGRKTPPQDYGNHPGNLGNLPPGVPPGD